jgi:16S rRNA (adenine1518-N6/adenine1519-N6)-dimethyltransferase
LLPSINYDAPGFLRAFLDERGLGMRKRYGQHFLIRRDIREKLLDALELGAGEGVWEIGPGLGAMTAGLLERGGTVTAFEIDPAFAAIVRELFSPTGRFRLIEGDVLKTWPAVSAEPGFPGPAPLLLGNLPYNVAAVLLGNLIEGNRFFRRMVVTVQRELARRMAARPGSKEYSSFSVLCASAYTVSPLVNIGASAFYPVPRVDSQGIRLDLKTRLDPRSQSPLFRSLVRSLFASRRKTVKNNLQSFVSSRILRGDSRDPQGTVMDALASAGIAPDERPERLSLENFSALAEALEPVLGG